MTLSLAIKATAILLLGIASSRVARRARASTRHAILACTFAALAALPAAEAWIPPVPVVILAPAASPANAGLTRAGGGAPTRAQLTAFDRALLASGYERHTPLVEMLRNVWRAIGSYGAWAVGAAACLGWFGLGLLRLSRVRREALPVLATADRVRDLAAAAGVRTRVAVLQHDAVTAPLTCGMRQPAIILPPDAEAWDARDLDRALVHELEHVRRSDWLVQMFARVVCAGLWFHPLAWVALRKLCLEAERACDDAAVRGGTETEYAAQLVLLAKRLSSGPAPLTLGMARRSDLSTRVAALLDVTQRRGRAGTASTAGVAAVAALAVLALAPVTTVTASSQSVLPQQLRPYGAERQRGTAGDRALYRASERGDVERMTQLIDGGADVNAVLDGDGSPLIGAARAGRLDAVKLLLDRGANPNLPVEGDGSPLIMAAREGRIDVVTLLLERGAQVDLAVPSDENALIQASEKGRLEVVRLLVSRGADVNARVYAESSGGDGGGEWRTPLSQARRSGHRAVVDYLQSVGARE
jgi:beta-lactamase regulating signal transducer with metallopeptidase domain